MSADRKKKVFCPLEDEMVDIASVCGDCELWDGRGCSLREGRGSVARIETEAKLLLRKLSRVGRLRPRRGRGLRMPPVREQWPAPGPDSREPYAPDEESGYGVVDVSVPEESLPKKKKKKKYKLPELLEEYWDVEPDVPDWAPVQESPVTYDSVPQPEPFPEDPQSESFPPGFGPGPEPGDFPGGTPGLPSDVPGPEVP